MATEQSYWRNIREYFFSLELTFSKVVRQTFVKELYHLKDSVAGCVGGMLAVGATSMKLHISVPEHRWFRIRRVAGIQNAIVAQDGIDVDIDVADLRYGERRELLVEVEMKLDPPKRRTSHPFGDLQPSASGGQGAGYNTATDQFFIDNAGLSEDFRASSRLGSLTSLEQTPLLWTNTPATSWRTRTKRWPKRCRSSRSMRLTKIQSLGRWCLECPIPCYSWSTSRRLFATRRKLQQWSRIQQSSDVASSYFAPTWKRDVFF